MKTLLFLLFLGLILLICNFAFNKQAKNLLDGQVNVLSEKDGDNKFIFLNFRRDGIYHVEIKKQDDVSGQYNELIFSSRINSLSKDSGSLFTYNPGEEILFVIRKIDHDPPKVDSVVLY